MNRLTHIFVALFFISLYPLTGLQAQSDRVEATLRKLTLEQKIGQLMIAKVPARADRTTKRLIVELTEKRHIGGLYFTGGIAEEQALLTNLGQKHSSLPLLIAADDAFPGNLEGAPRFPASMARACITDSSLLRDYRRYMDSQYTEMGLTPLQGCDRLILTDDVPKATARMLEQVKSGKVSEAAINAMCREVLLYKESHGLDKPQPELQVSGKSYRLGTEEGHKLAANMRSAAVTVLHNYFDLLPLAPRDTLGLLSLGDKGEDDTFASTLGKQFALKRVQLAWEADSAAQAIAVEQLATLGRVVISVTEPDLLTRSDVAFLDSLKGKTPQLKAPLVYVFFTPARLLRQLVPVIGKTSAVIVAHAQDEDIQQHAAGLISGQTGTRARMALNLAPHYPEGAGIPLIAQTRPKDFQPEDLGMKSYILQQIDALAQQGLDSAAYSGCRILLLKDGQTVYDKGYGRHAPTDTTAVRATDLFDLGELTQPMATQLAILKLADQGKIKLSDRLSLYLPALAKGNKRLITIEQALNHCSGLQPHIRFHIQTIDPNSVKGPYSQSWEDEHHHTQVTQHGYFCSDFKFKKGWVSPQRTATHTLQLADGLWLKQQFRHDIMQQIGKSELGRQTYVPSELGYLLLQEVVERVTGIGLDLYLAKEFYAPMGLLRTTFLPLRRFNKNQIMPTVSNDYLRRQDLCGYVQNETAACMGGIAGNAGLFSTSTEVAAVFQMLMDGGLWKGKRYLSSRICQDYMQQSFQYSGFTGTFVWTDPQKRLVFVFLSNRLCPQIWNTRLGDLEICRKMTETIEKADR